MNDSVTLKILWDQSVNYIKNFAKKSAVYLGFDLKIIAYMALPIYWLIIITATFLHLN
jgi:hypothetical protein